MESKKYDCRVNRVIDGDTLEIMVSLGFDLYHQVTIRVKDINCCELHDKDPAKKACALEAKNRASTFVGKSGYVNVYGRDKYGRTVADLIVMGVDYGKTMVEAGLAQKVVYSLVELKYQPAQENEVPPTSSGHILSYA